MKITAKEEINRKFETIEIEQYRNNVINRTIRKTTIKELEQIVKG